MDIVPAQWLPVMKTFFMELLSAVRRCPSSPDRRGRIGGDVSRYCVHYRLSAVPERGAVRRLMHEEGAGLAWQWPLEGVPTTGLSPLQHSGTDSSPRASTLESHQGVRCPTNHDFGTQSEHSAHNRPVLICLGVKPRTTPLLLLLWRPFLRHVFGFCFAYGWFLVNRVMSGAIIIFPTRILEVLKFSDCRIHGYVVLLTFSFRQSILDTNCSTSNSCGVLPNVILKFGLLPSTQNRSGDSSRWILIIFGWNDFYISGNLSKSSPGQASGFRIFAV